MRNALRIGKLFLAAVVLVACGLGCGKKEQVDQTAAGDATGAAVDSTAIDSTAIAATPFDSPPAASAPATGSSTAPLADPSASGDVPDAPPPPTAAAPPETAPGVPAVLTPADVDAYRRGQEAELARIEKLLGELGAATDETEKVALLTQLNDRTASEEHGAQAAGMEIARYRAANATIEEMIIRWRRSTFVARMAADTTRLASLPPERQAQMRAAIAAARTPYAGLPPATVDAAGPRVAELDSLHVIAGALVNQALRAAKGGPDAGGSGHP